MTNLKNSISAILAISLFGSVVACTSTNSILGKQQLNSNTNTQTVGMSSLVKSTSVIDVLSSKAKVPTSNGFVVLTTSNGVIEEKPSTIPVSVSFTSTTPAKNSDSGVMSNLSVPTSETLALNKSLPTAVYNEQISLVKKAVSQKKIKASTKIATNAVLQEGAERTFKVSDFDTNAVSVKTAVLKKVTKSAYFWVGKTEVSSIDMALLEKTAEFWEKKAFPTVTTKFAPAPMPPNDVDGEARINIFIDKLSDGDGLYGYFSPVDVIPTEADSNKTDMIYIGSWMFKKNKENFDAVASTLIHEFQHLTNFNTRVTQRAMQNKEPLWGDRWLNEALSTYSEQVGGFGLPIGDQFFVSYIKNFFNNTPAALIITEDQGLNYGAEYLFMIYLVEQYGDGIIKKIIQSDTDGIKTIESVTGKPFKTVFSDWATALLLSGSGTNPKFDFKSVDLHKTYGNVVLDGPKPVGDMNLQKIPMSANIKLPNWSVSYLSFQTKLADPLMFNLPSKNVTSKVVGVK